MWDLTSEQRAMKATVRDFLADRVTESYIQKFEEAEEYPRALLDELAGLGLFGLSVPEEFGGAGGSAKDMAIVAEELSYHWALLGVVFGRVVFFGLLINDIGTDEQKQELLPRLVQGKLHMFVSLTEDDAGSDLASLRTTAVPDGDHWVINGRKNYSTGSHVADFVMAAVRTDPKAEKHEGISLFLVDPRSDGVELKPWRMLGQKALTTNAMTYTNVRVPAGQLVGNLHGGWAHLRETLIMERTMQAASATGAAQSALDFAVRYANDRVQFGRPIGKFQAISHLLADRAIEIESARLLAYKAADLASRGESPSGPSSMAKVAATRAWVQMALDGMQVLGGYGYTMESPMQRHLRDSKMYEIGGGTSQIQRNLIARSLGL